MIKRTFYLLMIIFLWATGSAKVSIKLDSRIVDSITYQLYIEKDWDSLIMIGKEALSQDIDYYFLRVRLGIAYYQKEQYIAAAEQLLRAVNFNSSDPFTNEYLYLSLIYSNRPDDARAVKGSFSAAFNEKYYPEKNLVDQIHLEAGVSINPQYNTQNNQNLMGSDSIYGESDRYGNSFYGNAGITFNLCRWMNLTVGYSYLDFQKRKTVQNSYFTDHLDSTVFTSWGYQNYYSFPRGSYDSTLSYKIRQNEIYLASTIIPSPGFRVTPYFHLINVRYSDLTVSYRNQIVQDTAYYLASDSSYYTFPFRRTVYEYRQSFTSLYNYVIGISLYQDFSRITVGLSGSFSNLNNKKQGQAGYSITYYPFGNLSLYGTVAFTGFVQGDDSRIISEARIGGKIASWFWLEGNFLYGDLTNANISDGSVVYNNSDKIRYMGGANLTFPVSRHLRLALIYQFFGKESTILFYTWGSTTGYDLTAIARTRYQKYSTHTIIGGVTWKF